jgi:hypothetical protein
MKFLTGLVLAVAAFALAGCVSNTPAYSGQERFAQIHRNHVYQSEAMSDDIDNILLLRPSNQESVWNIYHRD